MPRRRASPKAAAARLANSADGRQRSCRAPAELLADPPIGDPKKKKKRNGWAADVLLALSQARIEARPASTLARASCAPISASWPRWPTTTSSTGRSSRSGTRRTTAAPTTDRRKRARWRRCRGRRALRSDPASTRARRQSLRRHVREPAARRRRAAGRLEAVGARYRRGAPARRRSLDRRRKKWAGEATRPSCCACIAAREAARALAGALVHLPDHRPVGGTSGACGRCCCSAAAAVASHLACVALVLYAVAFPRSLVWAISPTQEDHDELERDPRDIPAPLVQLPRRRAPRSRSRSGCSRARAC